jgi:hypothetical protein
MYIITGEGLGQPPPCSVELSQFLEKVRGSPSDYKKLLLLARFHPFPGVATSIGGYQATGAFNLIDCATNAGVSIDKVIAQLRKISDANLKFQPWKKEINAENQLWARVREALKKVNPSKVKAFLLKPEQLALLEPALLYPRKMSHPNPQDVLNFEDIGAKFSGSFGKEFLDISQSDAFEAHYVKLGHLLTSYAIGDPAVKQAVRLERERRRRAERAEERQIQQQIRYLRRMHVIPGL